MDSLCSLFDAVACIGELLGRSEEKDQELSALASTVESVSQSVRTFAFDMSPEERDDVFNSNQVFPQLARHLRQCDEVIAGYRTVGGSEQQKQLEDKAASDRPVLSSLKRNLLSSSKTLHEGLEVLSGKFGSLGAGIFRLPEDKLAVIRQATSDLQRLVPQLTLAISCYTFKGQKRGMSETWAPSSRPSKVQHRDPLHLSDAADRHRGRSSPGAAAGRALANGHDDIPKLMLQLVSESPLAPKGPLPSLTTQELRPLAATSSLSLDSAQDDSSSRKLVLGRLEMKNKVPPAYTLPVRTGGPPEPLWKFISRDLFVLDVRRPPPPPPAVQDSLDVATLDFGVADDFAATLAWGGGDDTPAGRPAAPTLAVVSALSKVGIHVRAAGDTMWRWTSKDLQVDIHDGDRIAILLESPPGSCVPGTSRDLGESEATCLLGLVLRQPGPGEQAGGPAGAAPAAG